MRYIYARNFYWNLTDHKLFLFFVKIGSQQSHEEQPEPAVEQERPEEQPAALNQPIVDPAIKRPSRRLVFSDLDTSDEEPEKMPPKKRQRTSEAGVMIRDEDSISEYFKPVTPPSVKRMRLTERQREVMSAKKDKLPFMDDETQESASDSIAILKKRLPMEYLIDSQTGDDNMSQNAMDAPAKPGTGDKENVKDDQDSDKSIGPIDFSSIVNEKSPSRSPARSSSRKINTPTKYDNSPSRNAKSPSRSQETKNSDAKSNGNTLKTHSITSKSNGTAKNTGTTTTPTCNTTETPKRRSEKRSIFAESSGKKDITPFRSGRIDSFFKKEVKKDQKEDGNSKNDEKVDNKSEKDVKDGKDKKEQDSEGKSKKNLYSEGKNKKEKNKLQDSDVKSDSQKKKPGSEVKNKGEKAKLMDSEAKNTKKAYESEVKTRKPNSQHKQASETKDEQSDSDDSEDDKERKPTRKSPRSLKPKASVVTYLEDEDSDSTDEDDIILKPTSQEKKGKNDEKEEKKAKSEGEEEKKAKKGNKEVKEKDNKDSGSSSKEDSDENDKKYSGKKRGRKSKTSQNVQEDNKARRKSKVVSDNNVDSSQEDEDSDKSKEKTLKKDSEAKPGSTKGSDVKTGSTKGSEAKTGSTKDSEVNNGSKKDSGASKKEKLRKRNSDEDTVPKKPVDDEATKQRKEKIREMLRKNKKEEPKTSPWKTPELTSKTDLKKENASEVDKDAKADDKVEESSKIDYCSEVNDNLNNGLESVEKLKGDLEDEEQDKNGEESEEKNGEESEDKIDNSLESEVQSQIVPESAESTQDISDDDNVKVTGADTEDSEAESSTNVMEESVEEPMEVSESDSGVCSEASLSKSTESEEAKNAQTSSEPAEKPLELASEPKPESSKKVDVNNDSVEFIAEVPRTPERNPKPKQEGTPQSILRKQETPKSKRSERRVTFSADSEKRRRFRRMPASDCVAPDLVFCNDPITSMCMKLAQRKQGLRMDSVLKKNGIWTVGDFAGLPPSSITGMVYLKEPKLENVTNFLNFYKPASMGSPGDQTLFRNVDDAGNTPRRPAAVSSFMEQILKAEEKEKAEKEKSPENDGIQKNGDEHLKEKANVQKAEKDSIKTKSDEKEATVTKNGEDVSLGEAHDGEKAFEAVGRTENIKDASADSKIDATVARCIASQNPGSSAAASDVDDVEMMDVTSEASTGRNMFSNEDEADLRRQILATMNGVTATPNNSPTEPTVSNNSPTVSKSSSTVPDSGPTVIHGTPTNVNGTPTILHGTPTQGTPRTGSINDQIRQLHFKFMSSEMSQEEYATVSTTLCQFLTDVNRKQLLTIQMNQI
ncbi:unnamed protein product [Bursaphelenchus okinawaensis]|uniref:Uncharacterized protein n=1 Tax=Bursaphelenchus okinawaensis TaxID=465554 RepID=A0A811KR34_9BILA|nr:unnamed protein product [Bursaphelenchus okinawaensis]CAG9109401.1 unnamed protein product [Bursaphelenchus okinawaensis]